MGETSGEADAGATLVRRELAARIAAGGWSLRALGARAGVHHTTLSRLMAGRAAPTPRLLRLLAPHLGLDPDRLVALARAGAADEEPAWGVPEGIGPGHVRATLEQLAALAGGAEVEGLVRAGYGPKRALLAQSGMAGPALARLDALFELYAQGGDDLPQALRRRVAAALLYFVLSVDAIPDDRFPVGYLDDAWVAELVWREVDAHRRALGPQGGGGRGPCPPKHPSGRPRRPQEGGGD
ncbi:MAG: helix-turn-helix domain-containing protein [Firmicutes bacterium]|nr:helix-turn-helix domain-containing protein [Bacillota bacterium]